MILGKYVKTVQHAMNTKLGFDLGTSQLRMWQQPQGVTLKYPHVVAIDKRQNKVVAVGEEAEEMFGRVPESIEIVYPFEQGVMNRYAVSEGLYRHLFQQTFGKFFFFKPIVMVNVASDATAVERQAVSEAFFGAGARQVYLIESPLAAAIGSGVPVAESNGNIVVLLGAGICEIAVISLGTIVFSKSIRVGGMDLDREIQRELKKKYGVAVSINTVQKLKHQLIDLRQPQSTATIVLKVKDLVTGYPKEIPVQAKAILPALESPIKEMTQMLQEFLEDLPAELAADVIDKGILLSGGGAKLKGFDYCLSQVMGVPVSVAEEPELCVIKGVGVALKHLDLYRQSVAFESLR